MGTSGIRLGVASISEGDILGRLSSGICGRQMSNDGALGRLLMQPELRAHLEVIHLDEERQFLHLLGSGIDPP
jgi:hypothetical protein